MTKEEYYSRMEKIEGKLRTDRCSFDEVHNLSIQQNYLKTQYIKTLEQENQRLKQWDKNKDTRNSRQRVENAKLLKENQQLKEKLDKATKQSIIDHKYASECEDKVITYKSILDEIREYINTTEVSDDIGGILILKECMYFDEILQILDKVKE